MHKTVFLLAQLMVISQEITPAFSPYVWGKKVGSFLPTLSMMRIFILLTPNIYFIFEFLDCYILSNNLLIQLFPSKGKPESIE